MGYSICVHIESSIVRFLVWEHGDRPGKAVRGYTEILQKSCDAGVVAMQSPQILHGNHTMFVWAQYRGQAELVQ